MAEVLWLSNETPDQGGQGGQRRQFFQVRELVRAGHRVTLVTLDGPQDDSSVRQIATLVRTQTHWRGRAPRPQHRLLLRRLARQPWDSVVLAHTESWPTFRSVTMRTSAPTWVDLHNVLGQDVDGKTTRWAAVEHEITQSAAMVSVCSELERDRLLDQHSEARSEVLVMNHGVDPKEWSAPRMPSAQPVVKLFGNWGWDPNARGLDWFLTEVWPAVAVAGARCEIAGSGVTLDDEACTGVTFVGRVPALDSWTSDAWAVVVPVVGGIGAPVKYLEALASGAPVLSTVDGAPTARGSATLVSDDPSEWIRELRELLTTDAAQHSRIDTAELSWKSATAPLLDWLGSR